ncbi:MAG TPA: hypothetical protein VMI11_11280 [Actinomycetes bacterium]|nr:hypothetical protein [Actinomycetes bacterium]
MPRRDDTPEDRSLADDLVGADPWSRPAEAKPGQGTGPANSEPTEGTGPADAGPVDAVSSDDELSRLLADRAPHARIPWVTAGLVGAILLAVGYVAGGYHYTHSRSGGAGSSAAGAFAAARNATRSEGLGGGTGGAGGGGFGGGAGGFGGATIGTVKLVDGDNVYLTATSGATVKVTLAKGATVTVTKRGTLADLPPGTTVVVVGQTGSDGTVTATSVTQGGGFGGGFGARAGGTGG